jgi:hypothetical protein
MAGGDIWFSYDPRDDDLVTLFVNHSRRTAKRAGLLRFRTHRHEDEPPVRELVWDGRSWMMGLVAQRLQRDLPVIAEAAVGNWRDLRGRRGLATGFCHIFGLEGYGSDGPMRHLAPMRSVQFQWVPFLFACGVASVDRRLADLERFCVDWVFSDMAGATLIEELHTGAELIMRTRLGPKAPWKFSSLVRDTTEQGYLGPGDAEVLLNLSNTRRGLRHDGIGDAEGWLRKHYWEIVEVLVRASDEDV